MLAELLRVIMAGSGTHHDIDSLEDLALKDENSSSEESEDDVSLLDIGLVGYAFEPVIPSGDIDISSDGESESGQESQEDNGAGAPDLDPEHRLETSNWCV